jgi:hypothetical protein
MTRFFSAIFFLLFTFQGSAQDYKRTWNWYFGDSAGINFATPPYSFLNNSAMETEEGCATISDKTGNLLFYTNGVTAWNKNHKVMENGTGLNGNLSSIQSSIIVPMPENDSLYYIFTTYGLYQEGLQYHLIDISKNNGLGKIIVKNQRLQSSICESLIATKHQNGSDVWVLASGYNSNQFFAYLVTNLGLITCPVISTIGTIHGSSSLGVEVPLKFTADGTRLVNGLQNDFKTEFELFDFDKRSGLLSNPVKVSINGQGNHPYNFEFSPNKRYLYCSGWYNYLFRYDLSLGSGNVIASARDTLYKPDTNSIFDWFIERPRGIQITQRGKIIISVDDSSYLSTIEYPDSENCGYITKSINLQNGSNRNGLPNFISSYFHLPVLDFDYTRDCLSDTMRFFTKDSLNRNNSNWTFKKVIGGITVSSSIQHPIVAFSDTGFYEVQLSIGNDTVVKTIHVSPKMSKPNLGQDTILCQADSFLLNIGNGYNCYMWQDWITNTPSFVARETGTYIVTVTDLFKCQAQDSIHITFAPLPQVPIITKINDSLHCTPSFSYVWFLNDTALSSANTQSIKPLKAGMYKVLVTDSNGCSNESTPYSSNVGTDELSNDDIKIFPNPASISFTIEFNNGAYDLSITDITGRLMHAKSSNTTSSIQINCKSFHKGIYFIHIKNLNNSYRKKLIIQ